MATSRSKFEIGAFVLMVSGVLCKAVGALFRLPLTNLLGIEGIGYFQLVMSLFAFALVATCGGVTASLAKLIGSARAKGEHEKITYYLKRALLITVVIGGGLGLIFLVLSKNVATFQGIPSGKSYLLFIFLLPAGAVMATLRGFFQGYENMVPTAVSQVLEQLGKFVFGLLFAFYLGKFGVEQGVFGAFLGIVLSEVVAIAYLCFMFVLKNKDRKKTHLKNYMAARKEFDKANFSLTLSAVVLPLVNAFDALFIIPRLMSAGLSKAVATKLFGLQVGVVGAVLNFPLVISVSMATTMLPNISYLVSRGIDGKVVVEKGLRLLLLLILPTTFGITAISKSVFGIVYQGLTTQMIDVAFDLMFFGAFSIVFTALMQYLTMLLQANGEFWFVCLITFFAGILKALISFVFSASPSINIFSLVLGNIALSSVVCLLALARLKKIVAFRLTFGEIVSLLVGTIAMFLVVYSFIEASYFSSFINVFIAIVLGGVVYVTLTINNFFKVFKKKKKVAV